MLCSNSRCSAGIGAKGEPTALLGPEVIASARMPIFFMPSVRLNVCMITPIEPVTVVGMAKTSSPAQAR